MSAAAKPFESLTTLEQEHEGLLERVEAGATPSGGPVAAANGSAGLSEDMRDFVERSAATGVLLDKFSDRTRARTLHDYWATALMRTEALGRPTRSRLAAFDPEALPKLADGDCPYVGLEAFRDAKYFFGREQDTDGVVERLLTEPLVVVRGPSGGGKTSLVMAGVLPRLREEESLCIVDPFTPGGTPLQRLVAQLSKFSDRASPTDDDVLQNPNRIGELLTSDDPRGVLLVVDQFEEVFTLASEAERSAFDRALGGFFSAGNKNRLLLTVREEFHARMMRMGGISAELQRPNADFSVRPLGHAELRDAILKPAELVNLQYEAGVVDRLVNDVLGQTAALPLLQFALRRLWAVRKANRITREALEHVGGPLIALPRAADRFYESLAFEHQTTVKRVLLELVSVDELLESYRRPRRQRELEADRVVRWLVREDFLRVLPAADAEETVVEIKHESLVRNWPRLVDWINEKRESQRSRLALYEAARRWDEAGRPTTGLFGRWQLEEASSLSQPSELELAFLDASKREEDRSDLDLERRTAEAEAAAKRSQKAADVSQEATTRANASTRRYRKSVVGLAVAIAVLIAVSAVAFIWLGGQIKQSAAAKEEAAAAKEEAAAAKEEAAVAKEEAAVAKEKAASAEEDEVIAKEKAASATKSAEATMREARRLHEEALDEKGAAQEKAAQAAEREKVANEKVAATTVELAETRTKLTATKNKLEALEPKLGAAQKVLDESADAARDLATAKKKLRKLQDDIKKKEAELEAFKRGPSYEREDGEVPRK